MTRTAILYLIDSISTFKTFIFTLTHKDIFEFTHYCVIIQYNGKPIHVSGRYDLSVLMFCFGSKSIFTSSCFLYFDIVSETLTWHCGEKTGVDVKHRGEKIDFMDRVTVHSYFCNV